MSPCSKDRRSAGLVGVIKVPDTPLTVDSTKDMIHDEEDHAASSSSLLLWTPPPPLSTTTVPSSLSFPPDVLNEAERIGNRAEEEGREAHAVVVQQDVYLDENDDPPGKQTKKRSGLCEPCEGCHIL
jgi:hypothetical protein